MIVYDALAAELRSQGIPVIEQPQAAITTGPQLELWLEGFSLGGEKKDGKPYSYETLTVKADVTASGVARAFVSGLRNILRKMLVFGEDGLWFSAEFPDPRRPGETGFVKNILARFEKLSLGTFEYETEESPMPARFRESWRITITYQAQLIPTEEGI